MPERTGEMTSKILIVDDDPLGITTMESILEGEGYMIETANNVSIAL